MPDLDAVARYVLDAPTRSTNRRDRDARCTTGDRFRASDIGYRASGIAKAGQARDNPYVIDLSAEECQRILADGRVAHIAHTSDGQPYVTPMSYVMVDGDFYFRTGTGRRVDAIRANPRSCVDVTILREGEAWESVVFWGDARFIDDPDERSRVVAALLRKYHTETAMGSPSPSMLPVEHPIVAITPESITGRASGGGLTTKTRPGRL